MTLAQQKENVLKTLLILIWVLTLIHMSAEYYYLYWIFRWFDIVTHFLGGVWVGLAGLWIWFYSGYVRAPSVPNTHAVLVALITGFVVGVLWEMYEYIVWQWSGFGLPINYYGDTLLDLCIDIIGAFGGYLFLQYLLARKK
jgi:hypothetical protein